LAVLRAGRLSRAVRTPSRIAFQKLHPFIHQERVDDDGEVIFPHGVRRPLSRVNQELVERGLTPPWVLSADQCRAYWATRTTASDANNPHDIALKRTDIVDFLHRFWSPLVSTRDTVLELGPNAGPNLQRLYELGYTKLSGVEINPTAVDEMQRTFPDLAGNVDLEIGSFEDLLPRHASRSVDVVFTMAVLIHVHPTSHGVMREMARIAAKALCVIEMETPNNTYVFARNYRRVFERLGWRQVAEEMITRDSHPDVNRDYDGYVARLFSPPAASA
jgi:SAM-dependent methyltransferase